MKKILITAMVLIFSTLIVHAQIPTTDGTKLKCTGTKLSGSIKQFDKKFVDYYEFRDSKIYSHNMLDQFARESKQKGKAQKVKKLKISNDTISFKDTYYSHAWANFKYVTINRKTGEYYFKAKRDNLHGSYTLKAEVKGKCVVSK